MHPSAKVRGFLEEKEIEAEEEVSEAYLPHASLRGQHFLSGSDASHSSLSQASAASRSIRPASRNSERPQRPQTAHAALGEDCSQLWREVGLYAEQRKNSSFDPIQGRPANSSPANSPATVWRAPTHPAGAGYSVSSDAQTNPSPARRRPVSVYIAQSAREGITPSRHGAIATPSRPLHVDNGDPTAAQRAEPPTGRSGESGFRGSKEVKIPEFAPPRETSRVRPFSEQWTLAGLRPRSAGMVHTNPSYRLPPRPYTATRRANSKRELTWNDYEDIPEEPHTPQDDLWTPDTSPGHTRPPSAEQFSSAGSRGIDSLLYHSPLLTVPLFAIPGSTAVSALPDVISGAKAPPSPNQDADEQYLVPENPVALTPPHHHNSKDSLRPRDAFWAGAQQPQGHLDRGRSVGRQQQSLLIPPPHPRSSAGVLPVAQEEGGGEGAKLAVAVVDRSLQRWAQSKVKRRLGVKAPLLQKMDLHVRRRRVHRVRGDTRPRESQALDTGDASPHGASTSSIALPDLDRHDEAARQKAVVILDDAWSEEGEAADRAGIPRFHRESSDTCISVTLTVVQACDLENTKMWGLNDPYCTVEVEGRVKRTRIIPSTVDPEWNETFSFTIRNLRSAVLIMVKDKHADPDFNLIGVADFRIIDVMSRSGWPRDSDSFSGTTWFVLQDPSGLPTASTIQLGIEMEGCQNWLQDPEERAPHMEEVATSLMSMPAELSETALSPHAPKSRKQMYQRRVQQASTADEPDLNAMFQGQKPLEAGCAEGYYSAHSCGRFSTQSSIRRAVFALVTSGWFHFVSWAMAFAACVAVGAQPQPVDPRASTWGTIELVSYVFLSVEIALKSVAFGFADKASSFLFGSAFNSIDLIVAVSYWFELALPEPYNNQLTFRPFRLFRLMIPLTYFKIFLGLTSIFLTLKRAALSLSTVISLTILFFVGFGIFGVTFYHDSFSRRCVSGTTGEVTVPERWCKLLSDAEGGSSCLEGQQCLVIGNPDGVNFDHMGRALVSIFLAVGLDGLQDIMNIAIESEPEYRLMGVLFFIVLIFFCRLLLFNLCVAVVTTTFHRVRKDVSDALKALKVHSSFSPSSVMSATDFSSNQISMFEESPVASAIGRHRPSSPGAVAQLSFRDIIVTIVSHPLFEVVAMAAVATNVVTMALQHAQVSDERIKLLQFVQLGTEIVFVVELCFRMLGSNSLPEFFSRGHDKFDFFVTLLIAMHLFAQMFGVERERLGMLPSFSALRLVRLVSCVPEIDHLLRLSLASITNIINLLLFTFLFMSVFALCAMFLFRAHEADGDPAAKDFSSYWVSMNTLFQVLTADMWRFVLFRGMRYGFETDNVWRTTVPALFLMSFFFAAQAILLNLYIAVIVENFNLATLKNKKDEGARNLRRHFFKALASTAKRAYQFILPAVPKPLRNLMQSQHDTPASMKQRASADSGPPEVGANLHFRMRSRHGSLVRESSFHRMGSLKTGMGGNVPVLTHHDAEPSETLALGMFEFHHPLRMLSRDVAESSVFKLLIMATIAISMLALALEPPARDADPPVSYSVLDRINWASTVVFGFEFLVMTVKDGFLFGEGAYLKSAWNVGDFTVLVLSILDLAGGNTKEFRVLRLGRALRPLRLIKRNQGMRLMVTAITSTWRPVLMIIVLAFTVATVFALMGMALFKGRFAACSDDAILYPEGKLECAGTVQSDKAVLCPRAWVVPEQNFDTFSRAMVQCLAMNTFKWVETMRLATAATEEGKAPLEDYSWSHSLFFIIYEIVGSMFVMNLFVAFIIDGFKQLRQAEFKHLQIIAQYEAYISLVFKRSPHRTYPPPSDSWRVWVRTEVVQTFAFNSFSQGCMYLNVVFMATYSPATSSEQFTSFYLRQNDLFLALLVVEVVLNMIAFGYRNFLHDPWQWIDMASIAASCVAFLFPQSGFVRSFRLVKVLRMIKNVPSLRMIFMTLVRAIPQFLSVILLLLIISTMFAVLLVNVAGLVREGPLRLGSPVSKWPHIRPTFQSYPVAMYTLFHITQGEDWHLLVFDTAVAEPHCTARFPDRDYGDCGQSLWLMVTIFFGFKLLAEYVMLNLLIGMIIDTFSTTGNHVSVQFHFEPADTEYDSRAREKARMQQRGALNYTRSRKRRASVSGKGVQEVGRKYLLESSSCLDCWNKVTGGRRHDFILIEDVQLLLRMLPQPLGFPRNAFGEPEMTKSDRIACKLILAELNVIALDRRYEEAESACIGTTAWVSRLLGLKAPVPWRTAEATFEETFATLLYWRCPHLIPPEVKQARLPLLPDIVRTGHAVIISRCIKRWLTIHRDKQAAAAAPRRLSNTRRVSGLPPRPSNLSSQTRLLPRVEARTPPAVVSHQEEREATVGGEDEKQDAGTPPTRSSRTASERRLDASGTSRLLLIENGTPDSSPSPLEARRTSDLQLPGTPVSNETGPSLRASFDSRTNPNRFTFGHVK